MTRMLTCSQFAVLNKFHDMSNTRKEPRKEPINKHTEHAGRSSSTDELYTAQTSCAVQFDEARRKRSLSGSFSSMLSFSGWSKSFSSEVILSAAVSGF